MKREKQGATDELEKISREAGHKKVQRVSIGVDKHLLFLRITS